MRCAQQNRCNGQLWTAPVCCVIKDLELTVSSTTAGCAGYCGLLRSGEFSPDAKKNATADLELHRKSPRRVKVAKVSKRKELRTRAVLPVKMTGTDVHAKPFSLITHTLDLTLESARIAGVNVRLTIGQTVFLHRFGVRARFSVKWIGSGTRRGQCGLKALELSKPLWGISLPQRQKDKFWVEPTPKDRRRFPRHACSGGAEIFGALEYPFWTEITDISASGLYVKTFSPLPRGTLVRARINSEDFRFETHAEVRTSDPAVGMGLRFTVMSPTSLSELRDLLESLRVSFIDSGNLEDIIVEDDILVETW